MIPYILCLVNKKNTIYCVFVRFVEIYKIRGKVLFILQGLVKMKLENWDVGKNKGKPHLWLA